MGVHIEHLHLKVRLKSPRQVAPRQALLSRLAAGDTETVAQMLAGERRTLEAGFQSRLTQFFGADFDGVMLFSGPMAGALARALSAEAVTYGRMVFFDPKHFRTDSPQGEALVAHELAHTFQADDSSTSAAVKEAEALAAEAAYLNHLMPGGAPFASEADPTAPDARAAQDLAASGDEGLRAHRGRQLAQAEGPRQETRKLERQVEMVMERVKEMVESMNGDDAHRLGAVKEHFGGPV